MTKSSKIKRRMTQEQEFELMKLVFDKFLWLGFGVMAYGLYMMLANTISSGIYFLISGILVLLVLVGIIIKEYEVL